MTEVGKLLRDQTEMENPDIQESLDVSKTVRQQLESLRMAGLTHLPKGHGEFQFNWSDQPNEQVRESKSNLVAATQATAATQPSAAASEAKISATDPVTPTLSPAQTPDELVAQTSAAAGQKLAPPKSPSGPQLNPSDDSKALSGAEPYGPTIGLTDRLPALNALAQEVAACTKCDVLCTQRTQTVFGVGNPGTRLVFVGEGPGADEDRIGEPFVGAAGQLLNKIFSACKIDRSDIYLLNTVKCRPPANRNPSQDELANCWGYAERQLEILQPQFICCLGSVAARTLLQTKQSLGRLRKQFHSYRGSRVLVTYHPAYLLRTPSAKKHVWEDMQMLMKEMGVDLSKP